MRRKKMKKVFMIAMVLMFGLSIMAVSNAIAEDCGPPGVGSPGYWKNHPDAWPDGIQFCGEALAEACQSTYKH
jgi:hypothetical protein